MNTTILQARDRGRKVIKSEETELEYVIRKISVLELLEANVAPLIPTNDQTAEEKAALSGPPKTIAAAALSQKGEVRAQYHILRRAVISPRINFDEDESKTTDGEAHFTWIAPDIAWLIDQIVTFSKLKAAEGDVKAKADLLKNVAGSEQSIE